MTAPRAWLAFEHRPGITAFAVRDMSRHWRPLLDACRKSDGKVDSDEYCYWCEWLVDYGYLWGDA